MANVNDTNNLSGRLENSIQKIESADIDEADREAIREYANWKRRRAGSKNTARIYIEAARLSAERYDGLLTEVESVTEADRIIEAHENAGCTAAKSINSKLTGLKDFWRWCEGTKHGVDDYRWVELVKSVKPSDENPGVDPLDPEVILSDDEITSLREAATNYRDKAFIEFLADTGARITLATQMKRGDINLDRNPPTYRPNPEGTGHKGVAMKEYAMKESARHLRIYLNEAHPDDHDEAPLWAKLRGYDLDDRRHGAMARRSAYERLMTAADAAGIDRDRAEPHNLRKSAVVRMRLKHDMSWNAIQKRMEWSDSALPQMKEVYRALDNEDELEMVARELGYESGEGEDDDERTVECWNCGREMASADTFCRGCGAKADPGDTGQTITVNEENPLVLSADDDDNLTVQFPSLGIEAPAVVVAEQDIPQADN